MPQPSETAQIKPPGEYVREELKTRRWTQTDLATILGRPLPTINRILQGKHGIMPEMALALAEVFGTDANTWMDRESRYRLSMAEPIDSDISRRAKIYELAPIGDLKKRGWITRNAPIEQTEREVLKLLQMSDLGEEPQVAAAMRKSEKQTVCLTAPQRAWCFRTLAMAEQQKVEPFSHRRIDACQRALRKLLGSPDGCSNVAAVLASYGIRFVVVEHLTGTKIDGAAMWLNSRFPVIGMSLRYDRIDYFWFTLFHELAHIRNRDCLSCDTEFGSSSSKDSRPDFEQRADAEAADTIIPTPNLEAFIKTAGPGFSTDDVVAFAEEVGVHPGLVVGQLQYRGEIGYQSHRAFLVKVRELVTNTTDTDGWA